MSFKLAPVRTALMALAGVGCAVLVVVFALKLIEGRREVPVVLATATEGGEYHRFGHTFCEVVNRVQERIRIKPLLSRGSTENIRLLAEGRAQFAIVQSDTPLRPEIRAVATLFPELCHFIVRDETGILEVPDLKGRNVAVLPNLLDAPDGGVAFFDRVLTRHSMSRDDLASVRPLVLAQAAKEFERGELDAAILVIARGNAAVSRILRTCPVHLAPIDVHVLESWHPYVSAATLHRGALWGTPPVPPEDVPTASVNSMLLTHDEVADDVVQEITRILLDHRNELLRENPHAMTIRDPDSGRHIGIPLHRGARAFYAKGEPSFVVFYAEVIALALSIGGLLATGFWHLRRHVRERQKNRADSYNLEILKLIENVHDIEDVDALRELRGKLFDIYRRVMEDLDQDLVSARTFTLFAFPYEMAVTAVRHRELMLAALAGERFSTPPEQPGRTPGT